MIKTVIFDFDGVLVESAQIKTEAFRELFAEYPDHIETLIRYHIKHSGWSRYKKFRYFYEDILGFPYTLEAERELSIKFEHIVVSKVLKAPLVAGTKEFLSQCANKMPCYIVSGTPEEELKRIVTQKSLAHYFKGVYGAPREKAEVIRFILKEESLNPGQAVFIGDGESDYTAAQETGILFFLRRTADNRGLASSVDIQIDDLFELIELVKREG